MENTKRLQASSFLEKNFCHLRVINSIVDDDGKKHPMMLTTHSDAAGAKHSSMSAQFIVPERNGVFKNHKELKTIKSCVSDGISVDLESEDVHRTHAHAEKSLYKKAPNSERRIEMNIDLFNPRTSDAENHNDYPEILLPSSVDDLLHVIQMNQIIIQENEEKNEIIKEDGVIPGDSLCSSNKPILGPVMKKMRPSSLKSTSEGLMMRFPKTLDQQILDLSKGGEFVLVHRPNHKSLVEHLSANYLRNLLKGSDSDAARRSLVDHIVQDFARSFDNFDSHYVPYNQATLYFNDGSYFRVKIELCHVNRSNLKQGVNRTYFRTDTPNQKFMLRVMRLAFGHTGLAMDMQSEALRAVARQYKFYSNDSKPDPRFDSDSKFSLTTSTRSNKLVIMEEKRSLKEFSYVIARHDVSRLIHADDMTSKSESQFLTMLPKAIRFAKDFTLEKSECYASSQSSLDSLKSTLSRHTNMGDYRSIFKKIDVREEVLEAIDLMTDAARTMNKSFKGVRDVNSATYSATSSAFKCFLSREHKLFLLQTSNDNCTVDPGIQDLLSNPYMPLDNSDSQASFATEIAGFARNMERSDFTFKRITVVPHLQSDLGKRVVVNKDIDFLTFSDQINRKFGSYFEYSENDDSALISGISDSNLITHNIVDGLQVLLVGPRSSKVPGSEDYDMINDRVRIKNTLLPARRSPNFEPLAAAVTIAEIDATLPVGYMDLGISKFRELDRLIIPYDPDNLLRLRNDDDSSRDHESPLSYLMIALYIGSLREYIRRDFRTLIKKGILGDRQRRTTTTASDKFVQGILDKTLEYILPGLSTDSILKAIPSTRFMENVSRHHISEVARIIDDNKGGAVDVSVGYDEKLYLLEPVEDTSNEYRPSNKQRTILTFGAFLGLLFEDSTMRESTSVEFSRFADKFEQKYYVTDKTYFVPEYLVKFVDLMEQRSLELRVQNYDDLVLELAPSGRDPISQEALEESVFDLVRDLINMINDSDQIHYTDKFFNLSPIMGDRDSLRTIELNSLNPIEDSFTEEFKKTRLILENMRVSLPREVFDSVILLSDIRRFFNLETLKKFKPNPVDFRHSLIVRMIKDTEEDTRVKYY